MAYLFKGIQLSLTSCVLLSMTNVAVQASPIFGKVGLTSFPPFTVGAEAELSPTEYPIRFGITGAYFPGAFMNAGGIYYSAYGQYAFRVAEGFSLGPMVGVCQEWGRIDSRLPFAPYPVGLLAGVSAQYQKGPIWLRVNPHAIVDFGPDNSPSFSYLNMLGLPWVETGAILSPGLELSLRANALPVKLSITF